MPKQSKSRFTTTSTHWGTYFAETRDGKIVAMNPIKSDSNPSKISEGIPSAIDDDLRVRTPWIRKGWINNKNNDRKRDLRGNDTYVSVSWDEAIGIVANELQRTKEKFGNEGIYAGSYGWSWAGRFHHAQGQLHRFMNCFGGYTRSEGTYSYAASEAIIPHVIGMSYYDFLDHHTDWNSICANTTLMLTFGGLPLKNSQVTSGGVGQHTTRGFIEECDRKGVKFININPMKVDTDSFENSTHVNIRPGTDTAMMLAIAFVLESQNLLDKNFLNSHCVGYPEFRSYLLGMSDGVPKTPEWAQKITTVEASKIKKIAQMLPKNRTMITGAWGVQRQEFGEQPHWMIVVLAAMLGQIGTPGGGFGLGYSSENGIGNPVKLFKWPSVPQFENPIDSFIPVARVSDMLLNPGNKFNFNGKTLTYPKINLVYWTGGNPFHHQMNLGKLRQAFRKPETVVVNEIWWNSLARHADIILPVASALERNDIAMGHWEQSVTPMHQAISPVGSSKTDFEIFSKLSKRLGFEQTFSGKKTEMEWLKWLWSEAEIRSKKAKFRLPTFENFWNGQGITVLSPEQDQILMEEFRKDPIKNPLKTPSGKIEIFSKNVASFNYSDCPGHPTWIEPVEWLGSKLAKKFPIHLISGQPNNRLHSQLDNGSFSRGAKIKGREAITMNPKDAKVRGIKEGELVEVFNERGRCLAGVKLSNKISEKTAFLPTGAWYDPVKAGNVKDNFCNHGNPNVLTRDVGTSQMGQGPIAHSTLVQITKLTHEPSPVGAFVHPDSIT